MRKLWGGNYQGAQDELAVQFGQSFDSDIVFWKEDIECSIAHARMLGECGIAPAGAAKAIIKGLKQILREGAERLPTDCEDVHAAIEARLFEIVGDDAGWLHTGRSRNDQVATSVRLFLRRRVGVIMEETKSLQRAYVLLAGRHVETVLPGTTHQQHAQPITLAHSFLARFWSLQRAGHRFESVLAMIETCPLGSAALAGTSLPIDRRRVASELGFVAPCANSLDATSDRSFVMDAIHACTALMLDLSQICEELINWSAPEYGFVTIPESLTTGSSMMPQKRNPDMAELVRGRAGGVIGNYVGVATMLKGVVAGYNRDYQQDKPQLFASLETVEQSLRVVRAMIVQCRWNVRRMEDACTGDFSTATDLAEILVNTGVPFRRAHTIVGVLVARFEKEAQSLEELTPADLLACGVDCTKKDLERLKPRASALGRNSEGGTGSRAVKKQLSRCTTLVKTPGFRRLA